jgi:PadR family transcriptional regulator, regulatory protein PadR
MDKTELELIRGTLDVLILKALAWGPLHGYAIMGLIYRQTDEALLVEEGTLYPALWRLESKGLVEAEWGLSENNRKAKYYQLTSRPRAAAACSRRPRHGRPTPPRWARCSARRGLP